ncbi:Serine carboxypeptidase-like 50 [Dendrobium catenatum]|uniref:Serine carboxypeptidase-like 50 n=1 Tax=Dendrobium catenatum TaxID=906689 RepID=A0A2I0XJH1_9ASPA|nr:Serine carboxypeptidase-like 50 [Dendrobium catenatum]
MKEHVGEEDDSEKMRRRDGAIPLFISAMGVVPPRPHTASAPGLEDLAATLAKQGNWSAAIDARNRVLKQLRRDTGLATLFSISKKRRKAVKRALHDDVMKSVKTMVEEVLRKTRVLLYQGAFDLNDGAASVEAWVKEMEWEGIERFLAAERKVWRVEGEKAGYVQRWENLTNVVVSGAGHLAPADQRMNTQAKIEGWVLQSGALFGKGNSNEEREEEEKKEEKEEAPPRSPPELFLLPEDARTLPNFRETPGICRTL